LDDDDHDHDDDGSKNLERVMHFAVPEVVSGRCESRSEAENRV
jgi:hypothetical protein